MATTFISFNDLQAYANAQQAVIEKLTKENEELSEKTKHLEQLLQDIQTVDITSPKNDEAICHQQLMLLNTKSSQGQELTMEETKKVEIYSKLLQSLTKKPMMKPGTVDSKDFLDILEQHTTSKL